jgi:hypothetical protein
MLFHDHHPIDACFAAVVGDFFGGQHRMIVVLEFGSDPMAP